MAEKLPTYLPTYRKRHAVTQEELAGLSGCESGVSICEYERLRKQPSLETALALQAIFGVRVEELFPRINEKVVHDVVKRARLKLHQLPREESRPKVRLQRRLLEEIINRHGDEHQNNVWEEAIAHSPAS